MQQFYSLFCITSGVIGYTIHENILWGVFDFFFAPFVTIKWVIYQELPVSVLELVFIYFLIAIIAYVINNITKE